MLDSDSTRKQLFLIKREIERRRLLPYPVERISAILYRFSRMQLAISVLVTKMLQPALFQTSVECTKIDLLNTDVVTRVTQILLKLIIISINNLRKRMWKKFFCLMDTSLFYVYIYV